MEQYHLIAEIAYQDDASDEPPFAERKWKRELLDRPLKEANNERDARLIGMEQIRLAVNKIKSKQRVTKNRLGRP